MPKKHPNLRRIYKRIYGFGPYISEAYPEAIKLMAEDFWNTCEFSFGYDSIFQVTYAIYAFSYFIESIVPGTSISDSELIGIKGIIEEIKRVLKDETFFIIEKAKLIAIIMDNNSFFVEESPRKINYSHEPTNPAIRIAKNRTGRIFADYGNLGLILNLINDHYGELRENRYFLSYVLEEFSYTVKLKEHLGTPLSEEEKLKQLFKLINDYSNQESIEYGFSKEGLIKELIVKEKAE